MSLHQATAAAAETPADPHRYYSQYLAARAIANESQRRRVRGDAYQVLCDTVKAGTCRTTYAFMDGIAVSTEVGVLGVAKDEVTHDLYAVILRHGASAVAVPLDTFIGYDPRKRKQDDAPTPFLAVRPTHPCDLLADFAPSLTGGVTVGMYRHWTDSPNAPRVYDAIGSAMDEKRAGIQFVLYAERTRRLHEAWRVRPGTGPFRTFFSNVRREREPGAQRQAGKRFALGEAMTFEQMCDHLRTRH